MSRWAPDARDRLETAALDLFVENGYEDTTIAQIADRAGLNRATFFRHFADKREVLFGGEDVLAGLFADAIRAASPDATITECLQAAFAAAEVAMTPQQRAKAAKRVLVVAANSELQERGLLKHARIARSISAALRMRGADELTARLGAHVGMLAFTIAVERWMEADDDEPFPLHAAAALSDLPRAAEVPRPLVGAGVDARDRGLGAGDQAAEQGGDLAGLGHRHRGGTGPEPYGPVACTRSRFHDGSPACP